MNANIFSLSEDDFFAKLGYDAQFVRELLTGGELKARGSTQPLYDLRGYELEGQNVPSGLYALPVEKGVRLAYADGMGFGVPVFLSPIFEGVKFYTPHELEKISVPRHELRDILRHLPVDHSLAKKYGPLVRPETTETVEAEMAIPTKAALTAEARAAAVARIIASVDEAITTMWVTHGKAWVCIEEENVDLLLQAEVNAVIRTVDPSYNLRWRFAQGMDASERTGWVLYIE